MKDYFSIFIIFSLIFLNANGQPELIGTWYLDYIEKDGVSYPNYFNDMTIFEIEFTNELGWLPNSFEFTMGHGCETSQGIFTLDTNEITFYGITTLSFDCFTRAHSQYNTLFYNEFDHDNTGNGSTHNYGISGTGNDTVLTLTNPSNSNILVYKRQQPNTLLVRTWWLYHIDIPGNPIIDIPNTDFPNLILTNTISDVITNLPEASGGGECEAFYAYYYASFNGANNLSMSNFVQSLSGCATGSYEGIYFNILGDEASNFFEFEIINGEILVLTDLLGAKLIFGDVPLSIDDETFNSNRISLKQNPVKDKLILNVDNSLIIGNLEYSIYSIEGKLIKSSILDLDTIDISQMESGIYFVSFANQKEQVSSIKFIKK